MDKKMECIKNRMNILWVRAYCNTRTYSIFDWLNDWCVHVKVKLAVHMRESTVIETWLIANQISLPQQMLTYKRKLEQQINKKHTLEHTIHTPNRLFTLFEMWQNNNRFSWFPRCPQLHKSPVLVTQAEIKYFKLSNNPVVWNANSYQKQMLYKVANALCSLPNGQKSQCACFSTNMHIFFPCIIHNSFSAWIFTKVEAFRYLYANAKFTVRLVEGWSTEICSHFIDFHWISEFRSICESIMTSTEFDEGTILVWVLEKCVDLTKVFWCHQIDGHIIETSQRNVDPKYIHESNVFESIVLRSNL